MRVKLVFAADNNYAQHLGVALFSLLSHASKNNHYHIYILDGGINQKNKELIARSLISYENFDIHYLLVKRATFAKTKQFLHLNQAAYFRLTLADLLPDLDKVLYFDCDLLFFEDVAALYAIPLGKKLAGAVQIFHPNYREIISLIFPDFKLNFYFNSGVILLNLRQIRKQRITAKLLQFMNRHASQLVTADQDVLNIVLRGQVVPLPNKWNVGSYLFYTKDHSYCQLEQQEFSNLLKKPAIVHFDGSKPWSYVHRHPFSHHYCQILG